MNANGRHARQRSSVPGRPEAAGPVGGAGGRVSSTTRGARTLAAGLILLVALALALAACGAVATSAAAPTGTVSVSATATGTPAPAATTPTAASATVASVGPTPTSAPANPTATTPASASSPAATAPAAASPTSAVADAIQAVIQRANQEEQQALAANDPTVMQDTATAAYYTQLVQGFNQLASSGVTAIQLVDVQWGPITLLGPAAAQATTISRCRSRWRSATLTICGFSLSSMAR